MMLTNYAARITSDDTCPRCKRPHDSFGWQRAIDAPDTVTYVHPLNDGKLCHYADETAPVPGVWTPVYVRCECAERGNG